MENKSNSIEKMVLRENAKIKVIGVGGGGGNAVNRMIADGFKDVEFIVINTDSQVLEQTTAQKVLIGPKLTNGLGAGADPLVGRKAAEENREEIRQAFEGADLVYITAGMGGGTGTGAAPVVAQIAKDMDILSIGIVTLPFKFEGKKRMRQALEGKKEFSEFVNTLITIPNDKILESLDEKAKEKITMEESFILADSVLAKAAIGVTALIKKQGHINLDFADVKTVVKKGGSALMGIGEQTGDGAAEKATRQAMTNPLLLHGITGAKGVIMNFTSSKKLSLMEITRAAELVEDQADEDADIIFGHVIEGDDWPEDKVEVTIVATGFEEEMNMANTWSKRENREVPTVATSPTYSSQPDVFITSNKNKDSSPINVEKEEKEIKKSQQDTYYDSVREMEREIEKSKELDIPSFLWKK